MKSLSLHMGFLINRLYYPCEGFNTSLRHLKNALNQVIFVKEYERPLFVKNFTHEERSFDHFLLPEQLLLLGKCSVRNIRGTKNGIYTLFQLYPS